tara:strand:- start:1371 stop:1823 length:453 start_codon:yes stop_codon:yes gene_type:complete
MNYLFNTATGYMTCIHPSRRQLKTETTEGVTVKLNEIRSSDLEYDNTQTLQIVDDEIAVVTRPPAPIVAPTSVSAWAAKAVLEVNGYHTAVESYINDTLTGVDQIVAKRIYFEGNDFVYASPLTQVIKGVLELTDDQAKQLFIDAKALQP